MRGGGGGRLDTPAPGARCSGPAASSLIEGQSVLPAPGKIVRLREIRIVGQEFDPNIPGRFYYTWDWGKPWSRGIVVNQTPAVASIRDDQRGYRFRWCWGWTDATAAAGRTSQPAVTGIEADFEVLEDAALDSIQERSVQTLPRF